MFSKSVFCRQSLAAICLIVLLTSFVPIVGAESGPAVEGSQLFQKLTNDLQERLAKAPPAEKEEVARALLSKPQGGGQSGEQIVFTRTRTFGGIHDSVATRGPWVYSASGYQLNIFLQAGGPQDLALFSQMELQEVVWDIAISEDGRLAILASGVGVHFVDISNPSLPVEVGYYPSRGFADSVAIMDSHTVAVSDGIELLVLGFADPTHPWLVSSYDPGGWLRFVRTQGNTIYAISGGEGLYILDFNYQRGVRLLGFHAIPSWVYSVAVKQQGDGRLIAVAAWEHGIATIDVTIPTEPTLLGTCPNLGSAKDVVVYGDTAYVADEMRGLLAIDISNPAQPIIASNRDTANALAVAVDSLGYIYIADATGLLTFVRATPAGEIFKVGSYDFPGFPRRLERYLGHFFVAGWSTGLHIATRDWEQLWYQPNAQGATAVAFFGQYAFVVNYDGDLEVLTSGYRGYLATPGQASDIVIAGRYAYVADGSEGGLRIYDISSPMDTHEVSSLKLPGNVWGVTVAGNFAYVADGGAGAQIVDIADPAHPKLVGNIPTSSWTHEVAVSWPYLYVAGGNDGVAIWNVSVPSHPQFVGAFPFNYAESIAIQGGYAFVGEADGLRVLDVKDPARPVSVGYCWLNRGVYDVKVAGNQVWLVGDFGVIELHYAIISTLYHLALPFLMK